MRVPSIPTLAIFACLFLLSSCKGSSEFPGYVEVKINKDASEYLFDPSTVIRNGEAVNFKLIKKMKDGYAMQAASTNCATNINFYDGAFYSYHKSDGQQAYPGSHDPFDVDSDPAMKALMKDVCSVNKQKDMPSKVTVPESSPTKGLVSVDPGPGSSVDANGRGNPEGEQGCDKEYPCRLRKIMDDSDWSGIASALSFATQMDVKTKVKWSGKNNHHNGYILVSDVQPSADKCRLFHIVSAMGGETGRDDITACQNPDGSLTFK